MTVALNSLAVVFFQDNGGHQDTHNGAIFLGVIAGCMVLQALAVFAVAFAGFKLLKKIDTVADTFEQKTTPILAKATSLIDDLGPKIRSIVTNAEDISYTARVKVDELSKTIDQLNRTVQDVNERSRVQVSRVDGIVSDVLATTYEVSRTVQEGIKGPVRQMAGVVAGLKAGLETLVARSPFKSRVEEDPYDL